MSKKSSNFAPAFAKESVRGVAQPGSATVWGTGGRVFESRLPDRKTASAVFLGRRIPTRVLPCLFHQREVHFGYRLNLDADEYGLHMCILAHQTYPPVRFVHIGKAADA